MNDKPYVVDYLSAWEVQLEEINKIKKTIQDVLFDEAKKEAGEHRRWCIRPLLASDLNLFTWKVPKGEQYWIQTQVAEFRFLGIYKLIVVSRDPSISELRFTIGGTDEAYFELEPLYSLIPLLDSIDKQEPDWVLKKFGDLQNIRMEAYLVRPLILRQQVRVEVRVQPPGDGKDWVVLGGYTCEPDGMKIKV